MNVVISNVPGPNHPLYSAGAELKHFYPVSTISDGIGLNLTVQSYNGQLDFGFVGDRDLVPDLWVLVDLLHESMEELHGRAMAEQQLVGRRRPSGRRQERRPTATKTVARRPATQVDAPKKQQPRRREKKSAAQAVPASPAAASAQ